MNRNAKPKGIFWCFPRLFTRYSFTLLLSIILSSESVGAIPKGTGLQIAQQPEATSSQANRAAAKRAYDEGYQLYKQGTAESLRQARAKFFEAHNSKCGNKKIGKTPIIGRRLPCRASGADAEYSTRSYVRGNGFSGLLPLLYQRLCLWAGIPRFHLGTSERVTS